MQSSEIRSRFLKFFEERGHAILPSAPLIPENDPSVLFNTAGMQPLVPYLLGQPHPMGKRLVNAQKCVRTNDIEEVGDNTHFTFFEMLGNWSLGDYFKKEAIQWSYEFLTDKEKGLGLDPNRLYVTVFEGNEDAPRDMEAVEIWKQFMPEDRIYFLPAKNNWWAAGDNGPCGPDTEMFYDRTEHGLGDMTHEEYLAADDRQEVVEIWNDVFMQFLKKDGKVVGELENKNIDTGAGLERISAILQNKKSPYETDLFADVISFIESKSAATYADQTRNYRVLADHLRTSVFLIGDGAVPSNKDQGYITRRLLRRAIRMADKIGFDTKLIPQVVDIIIAKYADVYSVLADKKEFISTELDKEVQKFKKTLSDGLKEFEKIADLNSRHDNVCIQEFGSFNTTSNVNEISGKEVFNLVTTYGFPYELIVEEATERGLHLDVIGYNKLIAEHQEKSRTASEGKFKGGLGGDSPKITAFHTSTHLMLAALRKYLGDHVHQAGSNITEERTRFDFTHGEKVSREILDKVEEYVNNAVAAGASVSIIEMPKDQAQAEGVEGSFWEKYPEVVKVYQVSDDQGNIYSRELCGGPHVEHTGAIGSFGRFVITKEEASSAGVRRIKAEFK